MARHASIMRVIGHQGRGRPGVRPHTTAMLLAAADVEKEFGTAKALDALLATYMTTAMTLAANGAGSASDFIAKLTDATAQMTEVRDALAAGAPLPSRVVQGTLEVPRDAETAAIKSLLGKGGGHA